MNARATLKNMATDKLEVDMSEEAKRVSGTFHLKYQHWMSGTFKVCTTLRLGVSTITGLQSPLFFSNL